MVEADNPTPRASSTHAGRRLRVKTSMASELTCEPLSDPPCSPRAIDSAHDSVPCPSTLIDSMSQSVCHLLPVTIARPVVEPQVSQSLLMRQATQHQCTLACMMWPSTHVLQRLWLTGSKSWRWQLGGRERQQTRDSRLGPKDALAMWIHK